MIRPEPPAEQLEAYLVLKQEQIVQIVLLLLMQEGASDRLQAFLSRSEQLDSQPVQR
jgi:hypothetical protein